MIKRIVRMRFRKSKVPQFLELFRQNCEAIRAFEGCRYLELLQDSEEANTYFTLSVWQNEEALEAYRRSELFRETWKQTKELFKSKAKAWTATSYIVV